MTDESGKPVDGARLLWAIAGLESSWGKQREYVRPEPSYLPGGGYYVGSAELRAEHHRWGVLAGCSYGSWQMMYPTARELGFAGHPIELQDDKVLGQLVVRLILKRFVARQGAKTLRDILDSYNSGSHKDKLIPAAYIRNGLTLYERGIEDEL